MINILVVEDDRPSGLILQKLLTKSGYKVSAIVEKGEEALSIIEQDKPDLILMDINLAGEIDGIETARRIFSNYKIPFIYITSSTDSETFERAKESMPLNYIIKPFNSHSLKSSIEIALYKFDMEKKLRESEENKRKILSSIPDKMFEVDIMGKPLTRIDEEVMSRIWTDKIGFKAREYFTKALETNQIQIFEYNLPRGAAQEYYESRIIHSGNGRLLIVTRNITDKKMADYALNKQMTDMEGIINERTREFQELNKNLQEEIDHRNSAEKNVNVFIDAIEQSTNAIVIINSKGQLEYVNHKFSEISGYSADELLHLDISKTPNPIIPEQSLRDEIASNENWHGEIYNTGKDGQLYYVKTTISKIRDDEGNITHIVITGEDITQQKKDAMAVDRMKEVLSKSSSGLIEKDMDWQTWKEKMLNRNISRTDKSIFSNINNSFTQGAGFGTLITFMEMMSRSAKKHEDKLLIDAELFKHAMDNVKIAQDAFKIFASIDYVIANEIEMKIMTVNELHSLIKGAVRKADKFSSINRHRIIMNDFPAALKNQKVRIGTEYISDAIFELLINAMKFSKPDTNIIIMIFSQANNLRISVLSEPQKSSDDILGIPPEYEKTILEPFYRISRLVYEKYNTLDFGIGLTLVDKIVTRHGGEIFAENILDYSDVTKDPHVKVNIMMSLPYAKDMEE